MKKTSEDWVAGQEIARTELKLNVVSTEPLTLQDIAAWFVKHKDEAGWKALAKIFVEVVQA